MIPESDEIFLHRRVKPLQGNKELDLVRLKPPSGKNINKNTKDDVDTVIKEGKCYVVTNGKDENRFGGISVNVFQNDEKVHSKGYIPILTNSEPIYNAYYETDDGLNEALWHCYRCKKRDLPAVYDLSPIDNNSHAVIYPKEELLLPQPYKHTSTPQMMSHFPGIKEMEWEFCCNLRLDMKARMDAMGGEFYDSDMFEDSDVSFLFYMLETSSVCASFCDESEAFLEMAFWININCRPEDSLSTIVNNMNDERRDLLVDQLGMFQIYTTFDDECYRCGELMAKIQRKVT